MALRICVLAALAASASAGYIRTTDCNDLDSVRQHPHIEVQLNSSRPTGAFDNINFANGMEKYLPEGRQCTQPGPSSGGMVTIVQGFDSPSDEDGVSRFFSIPDIMDLYQIQGAARVVRINPPVAPEPPSPPPSPPPVADLPLHPLVIVTIAALGTSLLLAFCVFALKLYYSSKQVEEGDDVEAIRVRDGEYEPENGVPRRPDQSNKPQEETPHLPNSTQLTNESSRPGSGSSQPLLSNGRSVANQAAKAVESEEPRKMHSSQQMLSSYISDPAKQEPPAVAPI